MRNTGEKQSIHLLTCRTDCSSKMPKAHPTNSDMDMKPIVKHFIVLVSKVHAYVPREK